MRDARSQSAIDQIESEFAEIEKHDSLTDIYMIGAVVHALIRIVRVLCAHVLSHDFSPRDREV